MSAIEIINKYYPEENELKKILLRHSRSVGEKALWIADRHPEFNLDREFLYEASLLHDIGIFLTDAPGIYCYGSKPYICHGYLGAELVRREGLPKHALVCERHTGAGISLQEIKAKNIPIPQREMVPQSMEEQVVCFADKFYSKSHPDREKSVEKIIKGLSKYGEESVSRFQHWCRIFL
ncbi:HD domain-containing protein [Bacteroides sp. OttesenSCG-928-F21]|nr:HD domain-containing protein [Bacteroides sp. OttesenSCG-928-F21]